MDRYGTFIHKIPPQREMRSISEILIKHKNTPSFSNHSFPVNFIPLPCFVCKDTSEKLTIQ